MVATWQSLDSQAVCIKMGSEHHMGNDLTWDGGLIFLLSCVLQCYVQSPHSFVQYGPTNDTFCCYVGFFLKLFF